MNIEKWFPVALIAFAVYMAAVLLAYNLTTASGISSFIYRLLLFVLKCIPFYLLIVARPVWLQGIALLDIVLSIISIFYVSGQLTEDVSIKSKGDISAKAISVFKSIFYTVPTTLAEALFFISHILFILIFAYAALAMRISFQTRMLCVLNVLSYIGGFIVMHFFDVAQWNLTLPQQYLQHSGGLILAALVTYPIHIFWKRKMMHE